VLKSNQQFLDQAQRPNKFYGRSIFSMKFNHPQQLVPKLWYDNIGATFLTVNPMFHARTKYIEINYHFVQEKVASNQLKVQFICSTDQLADVMTKPLPLPRFLVLRNKFNVTGISLARGGVLR
jgi:hypothetical protein